MRRWIAAATVVGLGFGAAPASALATIRPGAKCSVEGATTTAKNGPFHCGPAVVSGVKRLAWIPGAATTVTTAPAPVVVAAITPAPTAPTTTAKPYAPISVKEAVDWAVKVLNDKGIRVADTLAIYDGVTAAQTFCAWAAAGGYAINGAWYVFTARRAAGHWFTDEPRRTAYGVGISNLCPNKQIADAIWDEYIHYSERSDPS